MKSKAQNKDELRAARELLYADLERGTLTLGQATRRMRKMLGFTQEDYANQILKIFPRVLMDIENDRGNPTLETLGKIAKPFGLKISFVREKQVLPED